MSYIPGRKINKGFISPAPGNIPAKAKSIFSKAYGSCRSAWVERHPDDRENKDNKESCARIAWSAVRKAGYTEEDMKEFMKVNLEEYIHTDSFNPVKSDNPPVEVIKNQPAEPDPGSREVFDFKPGEKIDPLETRDLMGVEIFQEGRWKGRDFTEKDIDECVQNFRKGILGSLPYITIDHSALATKQFEAGLGGMALGFVSDLFKMGASGVCKLLANFTKVPRIVAELIQAGALKNKSVELWVKYPAQDGNIYNNVLEAVTFTGKLPAVNNLSDFVALYKGETGARGHDGEKISFNYADFKSGFTEDEGEITHLSGPAEPGIKSNGGIQMDTNENKLAFTQDEYTSILKMEAEHEVQKDQISKLNLTVTGLNTTISTLTKERDDLMKYKADAAAKKAEHVKQEARDFVSAQIRHGRILPKYRGLYETQYMTFKAEGKDKLSLFKEDIKSRKNKAVSLGEINWAPTDADPKDVERINMARLTYEEANAAVKRTMRKHSIGFEEAAQKLGLLPKDGELANDGNVDEKKIRKLVAEEAARIKAEEDEEDEDVEDTDADDADGSDGDDTDTSDDDGEDGKDKDGGK